MFITNPGKKIGKCDLYFFLRNFDQLQFVQIFYTKSSNGLTPT